MNIALVGHVSNGKTTLVNALTGVNTKKNSEELKTGKTIKLGYANCLIWKCECGCTETTGQAIKDLECGCGKGMNMVKKVSFIDAPGHHCYVHTMIKGAAHVDAAILVTDVRREPMQLQTMEHLAILQVLGVRNIIVVQNKADLIGAEECKKHRDDLRGELVGTVAENTPIIPISAQNNINLSEFKKVLYELVMGIEKRTREGSWFSIIRSFDVNRPGSEKKVGGVLGGIVYGNERFKLGDEVTLYPSGLRTRILSICSEKDKLDSMGSGEGLFGIGTELDPKITQADGLVGETACKDVMKVTYELKMKVVHVKLDEGVEKIKKKQIYQFIIGSIVVKGEFVEVSKGYSVAKLFNKISITEPVCLIYTFESSKTRLIAFGKLGNEEDAEAKEPKKIEVDYDKLVDGLTYEKEFIKLPVPIIIKENRNMLWLNAREFAEKVGRDMGDIAKYLGDEMMVGVAQCDKGLRFYKIFKQIDGLLKKYLKEKVMCKQCKSLKTNKEKCTICNASTVG